MTTKTNTTNTVWADHGDELLCEQPGFYGWALTGNGCYVAAGSVAACIRKLPEGLRASARTCAIAFAQAVIRDLTMSLGDLQADAILKAVL